MKRLIAITISFLLFIPFASIHGNNVAFVEKTGNVLYVGGSGPNNYTSIQDAINAADNGYTIYVYPRQYNESIVINKSISLIGIIENGEKPVINGSIHENKKVVTIEANNVTFSNFIVMHGRGMAIKNSNDCKIENNEIIKAKPQETSLNYAALETYKSHDCIIAHNIIGKTNWIGVHIDGSCSYINFTRNIVLLNNFEGINCGGSHIIISYNNMTKNQDGIDADGLRNSTISFNRIYYNDQYGIVVDDSKAVLISNNTIYHHSYGGIMLGGKNCTISGNEIYDNSWGISIEGEYAESTPSYNVISRNSIYSNGYGIYIYKSTKNRIIENNLMNNSQNAGFREGYDKYVWNKRPCYNTWNANYYSNWHLPAPKPIKGVIDIFVEKLGIIVAIPAFMFDFHPSLQPYKI